MKSNRAVCSADVTMKIEHIFFDLDGTLIGSSGDVKQSVWDAIEPLRGRIGMSVCTGRPRAGVAQRVAERLDPDGLHIFENGAMIAPANGSPAAVSSLDRDELLVIADAARHLDAVVEFYTADGVFVSDLSQDCLDHGVAIGIEPQPAELSTIVERLEVFRAHWIMREHVVDDVVSIPLRHSELGLASSPVMPGLVFGSVTKRGTSKGSAATEVARRVGSNLEWSAGLGDAIGDLPLLEVVGHPFVVANAEATLKQRFEVLGHVDEDGVESLLRRLLP